MNMWFFVYFRPMFLFPFWILCKNWKRKTKVFLWNFSANFKNFGRNLFLRLLVKNKKKRIERKIQKYISSKIKMTKLKSADSREKRRKIWPFIGANFSAYLKLLGCPKGFVVFYYFNTSGSFSFAYSPLFSITLRQNDRNKKFRACRIVWSPDRKRSSGPIWLRHQRPRRKCSSDRNRW